jgi:sigma-B regulation protein RsbU (phosphoserine phosphatase)
MPHKILVVDDEPDWETVILQKFRKQIQQEKWEFVFARNGREALEKLKEIPGIVIIVLDIRMPEMDGLTFLNRLQETDNPIIKTIVVTGYGEMDNIRNAMNAGAFDFLTKPINFEDLEITINKALKQVEILKEALKSRDELAVLNRELEIAAKIQESMLPRIFPPYPQQSEFDIFARMSPAKKIGGDFYDFFFVDENRVVIAIGDVSGKGIPAALYMVRTCIHLKSIALQKINPGECLLKLNKLLISEKQEDENLSVTLFYGVLNIATGVMQYAYAGHPTPFIIQGDGKIATLPQESPTAFPLGFFDHGEYEAEKIQFHNGDTLIGYTDGLTDAENPAGIQFIQEETQLKKLLEGTHKMPPQEITGHLLTRIDEFIAEAPPTDDITILALRYYGGGSQS